jgi:hypothetical protein
MLRKRYNNFAACIYEDYEGRKNAYLPGGNKLPRYILFVGADYTWNQYVETIKQRNMLYSVAQKDFFEILQGCCEQGSDPAKYSKMHEEAKKIEEKLASIKSTMEEQINKDKEYLDKVKFEFSRCFNWDIVLAESDYSLVNLCFEIQKNEYLIKYYTQRIKVEIAKLNRMLEEIS